MQQFAVDFPSVREAPPDVLRVLRAIDDRTVVVWLRRGAWLLASYIPRRDRMENAERTRAKLNGPCLVGGYAASPEAYRRAARAWGDREAMTRLRAQGLVEQQSYDAHVMTDIRVWAEMELWLRAARWVQQHHYEQYWKRWDESQVRNDESERKIEQLVDRSKLREAWRMGFRNPVSRGWSRAAESNPWPTPKPSPLITV